MLGAVSHASPDPRCVPSRIEQAGPRQLAIGWADGAQHVFEVRALRLACACASCVDEWSGRPLLDPAAVPSDVAPREIQPVGRYAIQIRWSDGHEAGIYPFERLRGLADEGLLDPIADD